MKRNMERKLKFHAKISSLYLKGFIVLTALNKIIKGNAGVSLKMSKALATAFEVDDDLFANLQKTYELSVEQK